MEEKIVKKRVSDYPNLVKEWHPDNIGVPSDYKHKSNKKVRWVCQKNKSHVWKAAIYSRVGGNGCPCCYGRKVCLDNCLSTLNPTLATQWHVKKNGNLTPFDITCNSNKKVWWICKNNPDHVWEATVNNRNNNQGCPHCNMSKGEKLIKQFLAKKRIKYKREKTFKDCRDVGRLRFDFHVMHKRGEFLIEFHGIQHYHPTQFSYSMTEDEMRDKLKSSRRRDRIKKKWAKDNNIPLLVIPYTKINTIEKTILAFIKTL